MSPVFLSTSLPSSAVSTSSSSLFPVAPGALVLEEPKDYPKVRFWTHGDYNESKPKNKVTTMNSVPGKCGGSRAAKDINVMHQYLEKSHGCVVSGREASAIRKTQCTIWRQIKKISPGELPETWETTGRTRARAQKKGKRKAADSDDDDNDSNGDISNEDELELDVSDNENADSTTSTSTSASASASTSTSSTASMSVSSLAPSVIAPKKRKKSFTPSTQQKKQKTAAASNPSSSYNQYTPPKCKALLLYGDHDIGPSSQTFARVRQYSDLRSTF
ncbi:hypothetical protein B0H14DRAFT_2581559 [Mycena olivaceomarginata]|nr:hypothetical protein B0H14DRAFT_2581559 [Mycena olivaceomarginata]